MDLFSIAGTVWRHKLAVIPVIVFTVLGAFYVLKIKPPVYQASSEFLLVNPPAPPSSAQIAADPALAKVNTNNPYVNFDNLTVTADALVDLLSSAASQHSLAHAGADPQYQVALSADAGAPPIVQITGVGPSAQEALRTASLVNAAAVSDLDQMQNGVNPKYMIKATEIVLPSQAQLQSSGKLRTLIAVLAVGALLMFTAISLTEALEKRRRDGSISADTPSTNPYIEPRTLPVVASINPDIEAGTQHVIESINRGISPRAQSSNALAPWRPSRTAPADGPAKRGS
jgi:capsular polysaccharide biosynthesis protein